MTNVIVTIFEPMKKKIILHLQYISQNDKSLSVEWDIDIEEYSTLMIHTLIDYFTSFVRFHSWHIVRIQYILCNAVD